MKYCVIGAGPCGLVATKQLADRGIPVQCFERQDDVGGNWYFGTDSSSVYASTHLISSKRMTEFTDFPMPQEYPPYPHHSEALAYLRDYTDHFGLRQHISFDQRVESMVKRDGIWEVTTHCQRSHQSTTESFAGVIVANGHHWNPSIPEFPGEFSGVTLHAHDYKHAETLRDKRVLVIGAGNSGCDIAVESSQVAASTTISMRRGYHFLPKFLFGKPADSCGEWLHRWKLPWWLYRMLAGLSIHAAIGPPENYGLPKPSHALFESHPIINSGLPYAVGHGRVHVKPNVRTLDGPVVTFEDGSQAEFDLIVYATGYHVSFPFLDSELLIDRQHKPKLYLNVFHPTIDNLFVVGLIQPNSGIWKLADYQSQLIANYLVSRAEDSDRFHWFQKLKSSAIDLSSGIDYLESERHALEVEYFGYRRSLQRLLRKFGDTNQRQWPDQTRTRTQSPHRKVEHRDIESL